MINFDNNMFIFGRYDTLNIRIKKNATNGDIIKTLFPKIYRIVLTDYGTVKVFGLNNEKTPCEFLASWWNEPYRKGENNGEKSEM